MTWREQLVVRILLLIARMVTDDDVVSAELKALSNHVSVEGPKQLERAA
jgi:hypothetical protein